MYRGNGAHRPTLAALRVPVLCAVFGAGLMLAPHVEAQQVFSESERTISVSRGRSVVYLHPTDLSRVSVGEEAIADYNLLNTREVLITGVQLGTTTLVLWDSGMTPRLFSIEVTADAAGLERYLQSLYPGEPVRVTASGSTVTLSGRVSSGHIAARLVSIAEATGATVIDNLQAPPQPQILLQVRFAEVSRTAVSEFGAQIAALNPHRVSGDGDWFVETLSDGLMQLFLLNDNAEIGAVIRALQSQGLFRSLAEPNLLAMPGRDASFLAGGEFPFPILQGSQSNAVTITFKEFGIRLNFRPTITNTGGIRLRVEPEVSSLDFANGLSFGGFQIPALLTRRASTEVELRDGQHLSIAGLLDSSITDNISKLPVLGDIPILGALFRSRDHRQNRTELLVIVTPRIVQPTDVPPTLPTGEPETWRWNRNIRPSVPGSRQ